MMFRFTNYNIHNMTMHVFSMNIASGGPSNERPCSSPAAKGYDCAFCDKSTKIGTLVVLYIFFYFN